MSRYLITANRLSDGLVVFFTPQGTWSESVHDAVLVDDEQSPQVQQAASQVTEVVGAYAVEVEETANGPCPVRIRERIRVDGPTIDFLPTEALRRSA